MTVISNIEQQSHLNSLDDAIAQLLEHGLRVSERPFLVLARQLHLSETDIILRIKHLSQHSKLEAQTISNVSTNIDSFQNGCVRQISTPKRPLTRLDQKILQRLQRGVPLSSRPFHLLAQELEISIDETLFRSKRLLKNDRINKINIDL